MKMKFGWLDVLMIILFLLSVYFILTRIFGHSASDLTITISLFGFLAVGLYALNREIGEFKIRTIHSFDNISKDMNLIKKKLKIKG